MAQQVPATLHRSRPGIMRLTPSGSSQDIAAACPATGSSHRDRQAASGSAGHQRVPERVLHPTDPGRPRNADRGRGWVPHQRFAAGAAQHDARADLERLAGVEPDRSSVTRPSERLLVEPVPRGLGHTSRRRSGLPCSPSAWMPSGSIQVLQPRISRSKDVRERDDPDDSSQSELRASSCSRGLTCSDCRRSTGTPRSRGVLRARPETRRGLEGYRGHSFDH